MKTLKRPSLAIKRSLKARGGYQICMISSSGSHKPFWFLTEGQRKMHFVGWTGMQDSLLFTLFCHLPYGTTDTRLCYKDKPHFHPFNWDMQLPSTTESSHLL